MAGTEPAHFADRLIAAIERRRTPLMVGLDPRWELLPAAIRGGAARPTLRETADDLAAFCCEVIDVVASRVAVVKPQWAFFEQYGAAGWSALERVVAHARHSGLLVVADAKRGDIGSTAGAYAEAFFREVSGRPFCDAVTVHPFLGEDSIEPFVARAVEAGGGVFVLVRTSNPGGSDVQMATDGEGLAVYQRIADLVERWTCATLGDRGYGAVGGVVGATHPEQLRELRQRMPHSLLLVPGFGAQGGTASDVAGAFDARGLGAVVNSSRAILYPWRCETSGILASRTSASGDWREEVARSCDGAIESLRRETAAGRL